MDAHAAQDDVQTLDVENPVDSAIAVFSSEELVHRSTDAVRPAFPSPSMDFDLITLKLFVAVVDEASITKAARKRHITGAAISKRISELESRLGVRLIERRNGAMYPTPAGKLLAQTARKLSGDLDALRVSISEHIDGARGEVRVFSGTSGIVGSLPDDLRDFSRRFPNITLQISERHSASVIEAVREGAADIGIHAPHVEANDLDTYPYHEVQLVLLVSLSHPLATRQAIWFEEAMAHEFIGMSVDSALGRLLERVMREQKLGMVTRFEVTGHEAVRRLVEANIGVGILPETSARPYAAALGIHCIRIQDPWARYRLTLCTRSHSGLSLPVRKLLSHLIHFGDR